MNDVIKGGKESRKKTRDMIRAQNDIFMVVVNNGAEVNINGDDTETSIAEGRLTIGELQRAAKNILNMILSSPVMERPLVDTDAPRELDLEPAKEAFYETCNLSEDDKVMFDEGKRATAVLEEDSEFTVFACFTFPESDIAQSTVNVTANGKTMFVIQNNGTNGNLVTQKICRVKLSKGIYNMELVDVLGGIQVKYIQFKKDSV